MKRVAYMLGAIALIMMLTGCSSKHNVTFNDKYTPKANTKVSIGAIANKTTEKCDLNIEKMLTDSMTSALVQDELLWLNETNPKLTMNIAILEYTEGSAFKRWIMPGWGATKLSISADIKDGDELVGTTTAMHDIAAGGGFTIGAWKYVFDDVAADVVDDLKKAYDEILLKKSTLAKADTVK